MTPAALKSYSHKDLAQMAKQGGVRGWHSMRKDQLVEALLSAKKPKSGTNGASVQRRQEADRSRTPFVAGQNSGASPARKAASTRAQRHLTQIRAKLERSKNVASDLSDARRVTKERIVVMVRDPYWLHAYWEIKRQSVERVQAAMSQDWHTARPLFAAARNLRWRRDDHSRSAWCATSKCMAA